MNLEKYIPFDDKKFRPHQKEAIEQIISAINNGIETVLLNAPVGSGKSLVGYCVAKYLEEHYNAKSYIYTKTTFLQDQYLRDFKDLKTAMGRSNFPCLMSQAGHSCDVGVCKQREKYSCPIGAEIGSSIMLKDISDSDYQEHCLYWEQKYDAIENNISILNYPYAITDTMYLKHFDYRKLGVFDEGHSLEAVLMSALELELTDYQIYRDLGLELIFKDSIEEWIDELYKFATMYDNLANKTSDIKRKERFLTRGETLSQCASFLEQSPENWVFNIFNRPNPNLGRKVWHVVFKPIEIQEYTPILFDRVEHKLIMSGSILKSDIFLDELGLDKDSYTYIEIPSLVKPSRRPIIRDYVGSMSRRNFDANFPSLVAKINQIADNHLGEKGIIHTFTYNINYHLYQEFKDDDRFIFHTQRDRVEKTKEFKEAPAEDGDIFVSPYSFEGVDFPYDEARWQIICKMPYPYLGDAQVKARNNMDAQQGTTDWGWCNRQVALSLSQMYGRTNRAIDDYSVTYLLDSDINRYLGPATLVTDYFLEGIVDYNYLTPLEIVDESKIRSRGNNYENQMIILEDIRNGLNTLGALRREYKKLPSASYVEVKKAVDYLLSCGAIRYV